MKLFRFVKLIYQEKCPKCKEGNAFKKDKSILSIPEMNTNCSHCNYHFEREPGYFIGALYLSYGLAIAQGILAFVLLYLLFPALSVEWILLFVVITIFLFAKKNFKWSRLLYIHIFPW